MTISLDVENICDKIQHHFTIKALEKIWDKPQHNKGNLQQDHIQH